MSDAALDYQIVVECNLAWVFPSPFTSPDEMERKRKKMPARLRNSILHSDEFTVHKRTGSEHLAIPADFVWDSIKGKSAVSSFSELLVSSERKEKNEEGEQQGKKEQGKKRFGNMVVRTILPLKDMTNQRKRQE